MATNDPEARLPVNHVVVCGLTPLGIRIVEQLQLSGTPTVVVAAEPPSGLSAVLTGWGVRVVVGSGRNAHSLLAAGIGTAAALVCVEDDDLVALETVLAAHDLRADLRIVVQMANAGVGRAVAEITGPGCVLDVASLAAPSIVEACTGTSTHELTLGERTFVIVEQPAPRSGTLRELYGDLAPLAVVGDEVTVCPGRDMRVEKGEQVTAIGTPAEVTAVGLALRLGVPQPRTAPRARDRVRQLIGGAWDLADRALKINLGALVALVLISSLIIRLGYHPRPGQDRITWLTSLYFTVETVATVGYGDFSYGDQSTGMQIFGIVLIFLGVTLVTSGFALLTNLLFSRRISEALGKRQATRMSGHTVVIGLGEVGVRVVRALRRAGLRAVVVERDENNRHLAQAEALGVPIIRGNATLAETLAAANVQAAAAVAVLTSDDLTNLETGLVVRDYLGDRRGAVPVVLRIFDRPLGRRIGESFAFRYVRSTSALAAPWFVGAALGLHVLATFYVEQELLLVARLTVAPTGGLAGVAMGDLSARIRVVALSRAADRGRLEHPPRRDTRFAPGDQAYLIGPYDELLIVLRRDAQANVPAGEATGQYETG